MRMLLDAPPVTISITGQPFEHNITEVVVIERIFAITHYVDFHT